MQELFIIHYCHPECVPLRSISQLSEAEAYSMAKELSQKSESRALRRFGKDFPYYYAERLRTEEWLYGHFLALGGKPKTKHPYYFALHSCQVFYENFNKGKMFRLPLSEIDPLHISFTFGDSVAKINASDRRDPFLKDTLFSYIGAFHDDVEAFLESIREQYVCIEAQLWTDEYLNDFL